MKQNLFPAIRLTLFCMIFFMGGYSLFILAVARLTPGKGKGDVVFINGQARGWKLIGQTFTADEYFWSRPSAVAYNAAGAGGSNKGPSNPDYLLQVQARIDSFMVHNPGIPKADIPSDLVTASGSGLDPDISVQAAYVQVKRIAAVRHIPEEAVRKLVSAHIRQPLAGLFGTPVVHVLSLNLDLDQLK